ncbi:MAG: xanthine phosphoribosyltransferase, partial [Alphaproteobacteria bacterium]
MTKKLYIKWDEFHNHAKELCEKIKQSGEYNKIVAISRGGLIPAGILAYELDIRNSQAINISSYDEDKQ